MWILNEVHDNDCSCSYCIGQEKMRIGLNIPKEWTRHNSWWVIKYGQRRCFRATLLSFLRRFQETAK